MSKIILKKYYWFVFSFLLLILVAIQYYGLIRYHYPVPPGDDPANHYLMAKPFYDGTKTITEVWKEGSYPPLYHYCIGKAARSLNLDLLQFINWTQPAIIILCSISIFLSIYFMFGNIEALIGFFLYSFLALSPITTLHDGGYPNLIAAQLLLPLLILFLIKSFESIKNRWSWIIASVVFSVLILGTHHITSFYLFAILSISIPIIFFLKYWQSDWRNHKLALFFILSVLLIAGFVAVFFKTNLLLPIKNLYLYSSSFFDSGGIWRLRHYPGGTGELIFCFGLIGIPLLLINKKIKVSTKIFLLVWSTFLLVGSRVHMANPERLARDAAVPLTILAAFSIPFICNKLKGNLRYVFILIVLIISSPELMIRGIKSVNYDPMVRFTAADKQATDKIKKDIPIGSTITSNSLDGYLPFFLNGYQVVINYSDSATKSDVIYYAEKQSGFLPADRYQPNRYKNVNFEKEYTAKGDFESANNRIVLFYKK